MRFFRSLFAVLTISLSGVFSPSIQKKAASEMAVLSGSPLKPLVRNQNYSVSATATFQVDGYYQFYAYMEDSGGTKFWSCGSVASQKRVAGNSVSISGTFLSNLQKNQQNLVFMIYCTSGSYAGYRQTHTASLELVEGKQYIDIPDNTTVTFPGKYHLWRNGSLESVRETLSVPKLNRHVIDPTINYLEILGPSKTFTYGNSATSGVFEGTPTVELWFLNHYEDFSEGSYNAGWVPKRRVFTLSLMKMGSGLFYFTGKKTFTYDRRTLQMLKESTAIGRSFGSSLIFIPIGLGRQAPEEEAYRWRLVLKDFTAAGHYIEFNGSFKRTKEDMGFATTSHYYIHVN